ncbi:FAD-binding molybdopterin dehydrogenase [Nakamurella silvestris]|nr:FAD-binding molybdopterin dehydrogenase [Nakamurella silvestris]
MDLNTVTGYRFARSRDDLALAPGEVFLGGGTWLLSEPQVATTGLVDLSRLGWESLEITPEGLRIGATCTIAELVAFPQRPDWPAQALFAQCANALLASFKVWNLATVGGNICRSCAAAGMVSLCAAVDATAWIWEPGGGDHRLPVADLVTGNGTNLLRRGEVLRAVDIPIASLRARTAFRKIALAQLGRSGAVLTGRVDEDGAAVMVITAATETPVVLRYPELPTAAVLERDVLEAPGYYTDALGTADWRRAVSVVLLEEIRRELTG